MDNPKISVITVSYNCVDTIEATILSVINQDYENIEYIIIDGKSSDGTIDVIKKYADSISHIISEPDEGIYDAWNKGLLLSAGEWIAFVGGDDILYPNAMKSYIHEIQNNKKINFISSRMLRVRKDLSPVEVRGEEWSGKMKKYCTISHVGSLHHKSLFEEKGVFDTSFKIAGDYDFLLRCYNIINPGFIPEITVKMRAGGTSENMIFKSLQEARKAKLKNQSRSALLCQYDYYVAILKFYINFLVLHR